MGCESSKDTGVNENGKRPGPNNQDVNVVQNIVVEMPPPKENPPPPQTNGGPHQPNSKSQQHQQQHQYADPVARTSEPEMDEDEVKIHKQMQQLKDPNITPEIKIELLEKIRIALQRKHMKLDQDLAKLQKDLQKEQKAQSVVQVLDIYKGCIVKVEQQITRNEVMQAKVTEVATDKMVLEDKHQIGKFMSFMSSELESARHAYDVDAIVIEANRLKKSEDKMAIDQNIASNAIDDVLGL